MKLYKYLTCAAACALAFSLAACSAGKGAGEPAKTPAQSPSFSDLPEEAAPTPGIDPTPDAGPTASPDGSGGIVEDDPDLEEAPIEEVPDEAGEQNEGDVTGEESLPPEDTITISGDGSDNFDRIGEFVRNREAGTDDHILIIRYTVDGDAILDELTHKSGVTTCIHDNTADQYAAESDRKITTFQVKSVEKVGKDYVFTAEDGRTETFCDLNEQ